MGYSENIKSIMQWGNSFERQDNFPLDRTDLHISYEDAVRYAKGDASDSRKLGKLAYIGQTITVWGPNENGEEGVWVYLLVPAPEGSGRLADLQPIRSGSGSANGDIESTVTKLGTRVSSLETTVGDDANGLVKSVSEHESKISTLNTTISGLGDTYVVKEEGKGLSTNDYTLEDKNKLDGIATGAQVNVIEKVKVNSKELTLDANKAVNIEIPEIPEYTVVELDTPEEGYATSYQLKKGNVNIGDTINIPANTSGGTSGGNYIGSDYVNVVNGKISVKYEDLKTQLQNDFNSVYDAYNSANTVNEALEEYKISNNTAVDAKVNSSDYNAKVATIDNSISSINTDLEGKVDKVAGKGLSTNDYTLEDKNKLDGITEGAQVNVIEKVIVGDDTLSVGEDKSVTILVATENDITTAFNDTIQINE